MNKQEKAELLHNAIGEIDEELILEAEKPAKPIGYRDFVKPLAVCASVFIFAVTITAVTKYFGRTPTLPNDSSDALTGGSNSSNNAGADGGAGNSAQGNTFYADGATLEILDRGEGTYLFKLVITEEQAEIHVTVKGTGVDSYGEMQSYVSTTAPYTVLTEIPLSPPKIKVNGESTNALPTLPGVYEIEVDLSDLSPEVDWQNFFTITPFGRVFR